MTDTVFRGRKARTLENDYLRVTVLREGGHIAEIYDKAARVNPLWTPPWPSMEPSDFDRLDPTMYGNDTDAKLLAGIMGHNLCLDIFGPPTDEEADAGLSAHGEGSVAPYELSVAGDTLHAQATFPLAQLEFERQIELRERTLRIAEKVVNTGRSERIIGWTQHVTLGPPFVDPGSTQFGASAGRSKVFDGRFGADDYLKAGAEFDWPLAPGVDGTVCDLRSMPNVGRSSAYSAQLMEQARAAAYFVAFSAAFELAFGYVWRPRDFPWLGIWEENRSRQNPPWRGETLARGLEFGVSPMPETRDAMIQRGRLFGVPCGRRIGAGETAAVEYCAVALNTRAIPESLEWPA